MSESNHDEPRPSERALADTLPAEETPRIHRDPLAKNGASAHSEPAELSARRALAETLDAPPRTPQIGSGEPRSGPPSSPELARLRISEGQRYRIGSEFAQGGIGRILSARDERLDRPVAIKELLRGQGEAEDRFVREALITARLQHPSIVPVYDAGRRPTGELFYAMKLVSGRSFDEVIGETRTLEQRLALLPHVLAVAEAIAYAHSERIIHRDLKPSNILVGAFGETVVIDWGLGKDLAQPADSLPPSPLLPGDLDAPPRMDGPSGSPLQRALSFDSVTISSIEPSAIVTPAITVAGSVMGTPAYMAPEQAGGRPVDERADVYALGAILYHLLAGTSPYDGDDARAILRAVSEGPPPPLEARQHGIPEDLSAIVRKAMAREVTRRYPTAKELAEDLRRFQTGQIVGAHAYSRMELLRRFARRYKTPLIVAAAALLVLAGVGALSFAKILEQREAAQRKEAEAVRRNDELTVLQARTSLEIDPNQTIAWLKSLSPSFSRWSSVRLLAADAESRALTKVLRGHSAAVGSLAFSPDGSRMATASHDKTIRLISIATGDARVLEGHTDEVWQVAFATNNHDNTKYANLIASASKDTTIRLWDAGTGAARVLEGHTSGVRGIAFSPDGSRLASCSWDDTARLWDTATGAATIFAMGSKCVGGIAFSADGARFATAGSDNAVRVWSVADGEARSLEGHEDWPLSIAFSPAGNVIASGGRDTTVRLWDPISGLSRVLSGHADAVLAVAFSPDGKTVASGGQEGSIRLWDTASGAASRVLSGHRAEVRRLAFSPDGKTLASASDDRTARLWDLESGEGRALYGFADAVSSVAFSPDGALVAASSLDATARLAPAKSRSGVVVARRDAQIMSASFSPDGEAIALTSMDGTALIVDLSGGEPLVLRGHEGAVTDAVFSPDGELIASAGRDGTVRVWDRAGHEVWFFRAHEGGVAALAFSPNINSNDGRVIASAGKDGALRLFDADSGESRALAGADAGITRLEFSPDGRSLAAGCRDGAVRVISIATGEETVYRDHGDAVRALAFSPDGSMLAAGSTAHSLRIRDLARGEVRSADITGGILGKLAFSADGRALFFFAWPESVVRRIDTRTGKEMAPLRGHVAGVTGFSMSPDGSRLASTSYDKTVRLWNLDTGESRSLRGHADAALSVIFSPRGDALASTSADTTVRLWWDDLPFDEGPLRGWLKAAVEDSISIEEAR